MTVALNGVAHIQLSVRDMARSRAFYHRLLHEVMGMAIQYDQPDAFYCIGGRTGVLISPVAPEFADETFDQRRVGLHHLCFRLRSRADVDQLHQEAVALGAPILRVPEGGPWAPGYYSVLFEDPDGIRLEANYVPGRGNLDRVKDGPLDNW